MALLHALTTTFGNAGAVANARRGAEVQHRHELAVFELLVRLDERARTTAGDRPGRAA